MEISIDDVWQPEKDGSIIKITAQHLHNRINLVKSSKTITGQEFDILTVKKCTLRFSTKALEGLKIKELVFSDVIIEEFIEDSSVLTKVISLYIISFFQNENNLSLSLSSFPKIRNLVLESRHLHITTLKHNVSLEHIELNADRVEFAPNVSFPAELKQLYIKAKELILPHGIFKNTENNITRLCIIVETVNKEIVDVLKEVEQENLEYLCLRGVGVSSLSNLCGGEKIKILDISGGDKTNIEINYPVHAPNIIMEGRPVSDLKWLPRNRQVSFYVDNDFDREIISQNVDNVKYLYSAPENREIFFADELKAEGIPISNYTTDTKNAGEIINNPDINYDTKQFFIKNNGKPAYQKHISLLYNSPVCINTYPYDNSLTENSMLCLPHNLKSQIKKDIEEKLKRNSVNYGFEFSNRTTHLLHLSPENRYKFSFDSPQDVSFIDINGLNCLIQKLNKDKDFVNAHKLLRLMQSPGMVNVAVAIINKNNILLNNCELAAKIFMLYKCDKNATKLLQHVIKGIGDYLPPFLFKALESKKSFFDHSKKQRKAIYTKLKQLSMEWGKEAAAFLAIEIQKHYGYEILFNFYELPQHHTLYQKAIEQQTDHEGILHWPEKDAKQNDLDFPTYMKHPEKIKKIIFSHHINHLVARDFIANVDGLNASLGFTSMVDW